MEETHVCLFATPRTVVHQAPRSTEFSRQEYWSGLSFPSPGDLPDPGIKPGPPTLQKDSLHLSQEGRIKVSWSYRLHVIWMMGAFCFNLCVCVCVCVLVAQSCLILCNPTDYSLPSLLCPWNSPGKNTGVGSHSLLQGIFQPRDWTQVSCIVGRFFYHLSHQGSPCFNSFHS